MFDWNDARYFLAIARGGSLSAAGRTLGSDQSTVGRRLAVLEEKLGARLFFRTAGGYVPTPAGEALLPRAETMEDEAFAIEREIAGSQARPSGNVRVTGPDGLSAIVLTPILRELQKKWPELEIELAADNRTFSLSKREADIAVRLRRPKEASLVARRVSDFGIGLYASKGYVAEHGTPKPDFSGHYAIGFDETQRTWPDAMWMEQNARRAKVLFRTGSTFVGYEAMRAGIGFAAMAAYLCDPDPDLVMVLPPSKVLMMSLHLVVHKDLQHAPKVRAVLDYLAVALGKMQKRLRGK
jgi:DNA-binding transcriptional LysR family regulator